MSVQPGTRAFVTGASGFIGATLVRRLLRDGAAVSVAVRPSADLRHLREIQDEIACYPLDAQDRGAAEQVLEAVAPDVVFNLATWRAPDPAACAERTNAGGLTSLLHYAAPRGARVIHMGSSLEYGDRSRPCREDDVTNGDTVHGAAKAAASRLGRAYAASTGCRLVILRLFQVYGPHDRSTRFLPSLIDAALTGRPLALTPRGFRRDWIYVDDVVEATLAAASADLPPGEVVNIASGHESTNEEIVSLVERYAGCPVPIDARPYTPRSWDAAHWVADIGKAKRLLQWTPRFTLEQGLERTVEWHRAQLVKIGAC
jgi:nucleoside-diphosphate-sugar epimerase